MTFYFYDLETSGINARAQRIMQFAGQRTDENFKPIGEPDNWLIKLTDEILPDPDAILITGITPQKTLEEGYSEAEFLKLFYEHVCQPDTVILGFNSIRFDDEFMRNTLWRNFYDPYEWQWANGCSRWDLLDVVRMIRALRPDGIEWPFDPPRRTQGKPFDKAPSSVKTSAGKQGKPNEKGEPTNRLELLTAANGLDHQNAHDALSDVYATLSLAKLLKEKQPKIFDYLLSVRGKQAVAKVVNLDDPQPLLYTSGRYSSKWQKTTAVLPIAPAKNGSVLVFDLRVDPSSLEELSDDVLAERLFSRGEDESLPVKVLKPNVCPAIAPLGVLDEASQKRLNLPLKTIEENYKKLTALKGFAQRVHGLFQTYDEARRAKYEKFTDPDFQIYDGFLGNKDRDELRVIRAFDENQLADYHPEFQDERLEKLLPRYKARNFPKSLTAHERELWEEYRTKRITEGVPGQLSIAGLAERLGELVALKQNDDSAQFLLQELQLWAQSITPYTD